MSDIVDRLRKWCHAPDAASAQDLMDEAAAEIERLQEIVAGYTDGVSAGRESKPTLTDDEREAVERAAFVSDQAGLEKSAAILRSLLARLA